MIELHVWGDSIAKGVVYDETRGRYVICRENCLALLKAAGLAEIHNYSVMGHTSQNGIERLSSVDIRPGQIAVIEYGGNDCDLDWKRVSDSPDQRQYGKIPIEIFRKNISLMVQKVRDSGGEPVLVTPPPLNANRYFRWISRNLNAENIMKYLGSVQTIFDWQKAYADCIAGLAKNLNVFLADMRSVFQDTEAMMCIDGIHPNAKGHEAMYSAAADMLKNAAYSRY